MYVPVGGLRARTGPPLLADSPPLTPMSLSVTNSPPQRFFGLLPLYVGVEAILGFAVLNKASGAYGILLIFTGHPITLVQALLDVLCIAALPLYIAGLRLATQPRAGQVALVTVVYVVDTLLGYLFTAYFCVYWFSMEDLGAAQAVVGASSESASASYELFSIVAVNVVLVGVRAYFTLVMLAFSKGLIKLSRSAGSVPSSAPEGRFGPLVARAEAAAVAQLDALFKRI